MLHCDAGLTMQPGPSLDMGLPGASEQGLPAQGMVYCSTVLEPFAYNALHLWLLTLSNQLYVALSYPFSCCL